MADQPDRPDESPDAATPANEPPPPAQKAPAAKKAAPAKKAKPVKKAPAKKAAAAKKSVPAKKATPAKKAPPKKAQPAATQLAETNGDLSSAANEAAAQAKSAVATASNAVSGPPPAQREDYDSSRLPIAAALLTALLAIAAVVYVARRGNGD